MKVTLTIARYPIWAVPFAFLSMAIFRLPLWLNKKISFYKLMGSGRNGTFDKIPDLRQWAILCTYNGTSSTIGNELANWYGGFISGWFHFFNCETFTFLLDPIEGHGSWDGKAVFGKPGPDNSHNGAIATLTRATIRLSRLSHFWKNVAPVANQMSTAKGLITSFGIGEIPWIKQATFSIWQSKEDMKNFAYSMKLHADVIKKTRKEKWYSEDMFVRFAIIRTWGTLNGIDPMKGMMYI